MRGSPANQMPSSIIGFIAMGSCLFFLWAERNEPIIVLCSAFLLLICATDTLFARIPNLANVALLVFGGAYHFSQAGPAGLALSGLGLLTGLALLFVPYLAGVMGAGDVKALAALGAAVGPGPIFQVFLYTGLIGGILALLYAAFNAEQRRRGRELFEDLRTFALARDAKALKQLSQPLKKNGQRLRFPYATAIAFGFFSFVHWGRLI